MDENKKPKGWVEEHYGRWNPKFLNISEENRQIIDKFCEDRIELYDVIESTAGLYKSSLNKFANFLGNKSLKDATAEDTKAFFKENGMAKYTKRIVGNHLILFYRALEGLEGKERPSNMKWFVYPTLRRQDKDIYDREKTFVTREEYDALIQDPSGFFRSVYLPRIFGALEPFKNLSPLTNILEIVFTGGNILPYGLPDVQAAVGNLLKAGSEALKWIKTLGVFNKEMAERVFHTSLGALQRHLMILLVIL